MRCLKRISAILLTVIMFLSIVPAIQFANAQEQEMSAEFSKVLTDGKLVLNYAKPSGKDDVLLGIACQSFEEDNNCANGNFHLGSEWSDDLSKAKLEMWHSVEDKGAVEPAESHMVDVIWKYDEMVYDMVTSFADKLPTPGADLTYFHLSDLEYMNYLIHTPLSVSSRFDQMANYSGEFKQIIENTNFSMILDTRGGRDDLFYTERHGIVKMLYKDTVYMAWYGELRFCANHIIYVPEDTADTKEALIAAAQKRIDDYLGKNVVKLTDSGKTVSEYSNTKNQYDFLQNAAGDCIINLEAANTVYNFVIIKDDSKLAVPGHNSVDISTNVSSSTDSSEVPLDTVIKVEKITHGEEHERICGTLEIKDGEIYDIKLHSGSLDDYISQLKNGKFKVRLPIPKEYEGKNLVVYYVDANGNQTKYNVTVKNNFAFFETDHFSIYTLTTVSEEATPSITTPSQQNNNQNNDNIPWQLWLAVGIVILVGGGIIVVLLAKKKKNT